MDEEVIKVGRQIIYNNHFIITAFLFPSKTGLLIDIVFENKPLPGNWTTPAVEVLFPINGYLSYVYKYKLSKEQIGIIVDKIYDISGIERLESEIFEFRIYPGKQKKVRFYVKIPIEHIERMKDIADRDGTVTLILSLYFSILYNAGSVFQQRFYKLHPFFVFDISKAIIENWMTHWMKSYAQFIDLPPVIPKEVLSDYIEAVKSFNVGAFKAAVAMARRALQQALEDRGAERGKRLLDQIDELRNKGIIDKATASLAHGVRQFGNYGAHPQTDLLDHVTRDDAKLVIDVTKKILKELYRVQ